MPLVPWNIAQIVVMSSCITNPEDRESYQEDQRSSGAGYYDGAEAPVAYPDSGT